MPWPINLALSRLWIAEQVASALAFEKLIDRLKGHVFVQLFCIAGVRDLNVAMQ